MPWSSCAEIAAAVLPFRLFRVDLVSLENRYSYRLSLFLLYFFLKAPHLPQMYLYAMFYPLDACLLLVIKIPSSTVICAGTKHSFSSEETGAFSNWINTILAKDDEMASRLPINEESDDLFKAVHDGILLWYVEASFYGALVCISMQCMCWSFPQQENSPTNSFKFNSKTFLGSCVHWCCIEPGSDSQVMKTAARNQSHMDSFIHFKVFWEFGLGCWGQLAMNHLISVPIVLVHRYMQGDPLDRLMLYTSLWGIHK